MAGAPIGNNNAAKTKAWDAALRRAIAQDNTERLRAAAEQLLTLASQGEQWAIRELADRLDGKSHQSVGIGDPDGNPLVARIELVGIKPEDK
jgi:23S rRNA pseudoU1915 N3-methylase RlmH